MFNSEKQKSYVIIIRLKSDLSALCSAMVFSSSAAAGHELVWDGFHIGIRLGCWLAGWRPPPPHSLVCNGNQSFAGSQCWQWCIHSEDTILAEGRANRFGIDTLGQQEFTIVFPVDALCV